MEGDGPADAVAVLGVIALVVGLAILARTGSPIGHLQPVGTLRICAFCNRDAYGER